MCGIIFLPFVVLACKSIASSCVSVAAFLVFPFIFSWRVVAFYKFRWVS